MRVKHPGAGRTGLAIVPGLGGEVRLKVWTVLGMQSAGPFRKPSRPVGPRREHGLGGPASRWTAIKRLLWEAFRLLGKH